VDSKHQKSWSDWPARQQENFSTDEDRSENEPFFERDRGPILKVYSEKNDILIVMCSGTILSIPSSSAYYRPILQIIAGYLKNFCRKQLPSEFNINGIHLKYSLDDLRMELGLPVSIPREAPECWPGKLRAQETVVDFFKRVWSKYIPHGLTLAHIRRLDRKLYNAIANYRANWPKDLKLPKQREILMEKVQKFRKEGANVLDPGDLIAVARKLARERTKS
jgi:hypothetical protein